MRALCLLGLLAGLTLLPPAFDDASADLDFEAYLDHLAQNAGLTTEAFIDAHEPFGPYDANVPPRMSEPVYFQRANRWLRLTDDELELLQRHDFVVSQRWRFDSYADAFEEIWHKDLPAYVSTDAILHAVHKSYDDLLAMAEARYLMPQMKQTLSDMYNGWTRLSDRYGGIAGLEPSLADIDVYITVALRLIDRRSNAQSQSGSEAMVSEILEAIDGETPGWIRLFNEKPRRYDFSQLKPRGHYVGDTYPELYHYFRTMMWIGRTEFRLNCPESLPADEKFDPTREIIDAFFFAELADETGSTSRFGDFDRILRLLIGPPDNVRIDEVKRLAEVIGLGSPESLLEGPVREAFDQELLTGGYTAQMILSQILHMNILDPTAVELPYAFLPLGQRFIVDSFTTGQVVFPYVEKLREIPDPLDVLYAVGNDDVLPFMMPEIERYDYARNLSALRYLIDHAGDDFWEGSLYNSWLEAIRTLSKSGRQENAPAFMKTGAWQQQKMNTQLSAWAELRHDNLLYGKQSYTAKPPICSFPCTYIEPIPDFYRSLEGFAGRAGEAFSSIPSMPDAIPRFFARMQGILGVLRSVAEKELSGEPFSQRDRGFLRSIVYKVTSTQGGGGCSDDGGIVWRPDGWYRDLFFTTTISDGGYEAEESEKSRDALIADVHTNPNRNEVLHVATGDPEIGIFIASPEGYPPTAYVGPVASYYEFVTGNFLRLTDEEWNEIYRNEPPLRPDWTQVYLADLGGYWYPDGRVLEEEPEIPDAPWSWLPTQDPPDDSGDPDSPPDSTDTPPPPADDGTDELSGPDYFAISPNPVRTGAVASVRLQDPGIARARLLVYDSGGRLVSEVFHGLLTEQLTFLRWDGKSDSGEPVGAGVYYFRLEANGHVMTRKVILVR